MQALRKLSATLLLSAVGAACGPPLAEPDPSAAQKEAISFEPITDASAVASVMRVHVASDRLGAGDAALFQGSLSAYYLSKIRRGEVPASLADRQVPLLSWRNELELVVAPLRALAAGPYSLAATSGLVAEFQVTLAAPILRRAWPPAGGGLGFAIYCSDSPPDVPSPSSWRFEPASLEVTVQPGIDESQTFADRCLHFSGPELGAEQVALPPPSVGAFAVEPSLFGPRRAEPALPLACPAGETSLGLGCAVASDDRALLRTPLARLLWIVHSEHGSFVSTSDAGRPLVIGGLQPDRHEHVWGSVHDEAGHETPFDRFVDTLDAQARPVLNEALANAVGPEPQSEWIEIANDGSLEFDLSDYSLQDGGGTSPLPEARIGPHEFALLVRKDFAPSAGDVAPAGSVRLIAVTALGKSGLSNSGERLALLDSEGHAVSALPALASKTAGQSLARRTLSSLDGDPSAFAFGRPTPGRPNDATSDGMPPAVPATK